LLGFESKIDKTTEIKVLHGLGFLLVCEPIKF